MSNENIILANDKKLNKQSQKRKITSKLSKKSAYRSENKIAKSEIKADPVDLTKFETFLLERTSTPHINICEHCSHSHARVCQFTLKYLIIYMIDDINYFLCCLLLQECCMYVYDDQSDIMKYSLFKQNVEEPYYSVISKTTPSNFPSNFPFFFFR